MRRAIFPARKPDRSFCVEISFLVAGNLHSDLALRIQAWICDDWMPRNHTWTREWEGAGGKISRVEVLHYDSEFMAPPEFVLIGDRELQLRLRGKKTAKFWRDWVVSRILTELRMEFPEVELGKPFNSRNCAE